MEITVSPMTRIEGHLDIRVTVDKVAGQQQVTDAHCSGTMFRGFEKILMGRDPRDATHYTQRICGVCPVSHAMASALALEAAFEVAPAPNGRILRNLVLGANYIQSHVLHFYHLAAPDYINTKGILDISPWTPRFETDDMVTGETAETLVSHYVQALAIRRKAHQMGAIFGGRLPMAANFVPGGSSETVTQAKIDAFAELLTELRAFIDDVYIPDVLAVAGAFADYKDIGVGAGNLLSYGVFDLDDNGGKLLARGRITEGTAAAVVPEQIIEYVKHSWYTPESGNLNPSAGVTEPDVTKEGAYSFIKSPRYLDVVHEVGPLARMKVSGKYDGQVSVIDRVAARAMETKLVADAMVGWLGELDPDQPVYVPSESPDDSEGIGLTEAPRGALGHWIQIADSEIARYQVVTPTAWNASPLDGLDAGGVGQHGAMEQALIGTPVDDEDQPIELLRVVHSFDPCLACAIHMVRPDKKSAEVVIRA